MSNISCTAGATGSCVCSDSNDYPFNWFSPQYITPHFQFCQIHIMVAVVRQQNIIL